MFYFQDILVKHGIDPTKVLAVRHKLNQWPKLDRLMPWLVENEPDLFNAVQSWQHGKKAEASFKNVEYIAAFLGLESGRAVFVGVYKRGTYRPLSKAQCQTHPPVKKLIAHGAEQEAFDSPREGLLLFELELTEIASEYRGKLSIEWSAGIAFVQYVKRKRSPVRFPIHAIYEENRFVNPRQMPNWRELVLSWDELSTLPDAWAKSLAETRGVYFIFDVSNRKGYVGAAYGRDNLLGRWKNYAKTGHGENEQLKERDPKNFRFSILQRCSPDASETEVQRLEGTWKIRLHTREFGMNGN